MSRLHAIHDHRQYIPPVDFDNFYNYESQRSKHRLESFGALYIIIYRLSDIGNRKLPHHQAIYDDANAKEIMIIFSDDQRKAVIAPSGLERWLFCKAMGTGIGNLEEALERLSSLLFALMFFCAFGVRSWS